MANDCLRHPHLESEPLIWSLYTEPWQTAVISLLNVLMTGIWSVAANIKQAIKLERRLQEHCLPTGNLLDRSSSCQRFYWIRCTSADFLGRQQWCSHRLVLWQEHFHDNRGSSRWCCSLYTHLCTRHTPSGLHSTLNHHTTQQFQTRWLYCVEYPQHSIRLEALGYLCTTCLLPAFDKA